MILFAFVGWFAFVSTLLMLHVEWKNNTRLLAAWEASNEETFAAWRESDRKWAEAIQGTIDRFENETATRH